MGVDPVPGKAGCGDFQAVSQNAASTATGFRFYDEAERGLVSLFFRSFFYLLSRTLLLTFWRRLLLRNVFHSFFRKKMFLNLINYL